MADHVIVANDTEPPFEDWLDYADVPHTSPDLPALPADATVTFVMKSGATVVESEVTVVDPVTRLVRKEFTKTETAATGDYDVEWQIDYVDGRRQTHKSNAKVKIVADLGGPA